MLLLASTSDLLQITTSDASTINVHATYADLSAGVVSVGRTNTAISTATTTTVVASPAASTFRTVKLLVIRNKHSVRASRIDVVHTDGSTTVTLHSTTLSPGETLFYEEDAGFSTLRSGFANIAVAHDSVFTAPAVGDLYVHTLPTSVSNALVTVNWLDVKDLSFPTMAGHRYWFRFVLMYTSAATGTGSRWSVYGPGQTTLRYQSSCSLTTTSRTFSEGFTGYDSPTGANSSSAATGANLAEVEGFVDTVVQEGPVFLRFASEVTVSAITVLRGSIVQWMRVT